MGKLENQVEVRSSADKLFNVFKSQTYPLPTISSDLVQNVELHKGEGWHSEDAIVLWNYTIDGKAMTTKEKVVVDEASKTVTSHVIEGDLMEEFKIFRFTVQITANADGYGSVAKWTIEYEKLSEDVADPTLYLDFKVKLTKDVDAHLLTA